MLTRDQERAKLIFEQVSAVPTEDRKRYGAMAQQLPILVRTAGLCQALEFVATRKKDYDNLLLDHLAAAVYPPPAPSDSNRVLRGDREALLRNSRTADLQKYMWLTREVLAGLTWYKRFAQSVLGVESTDEGDHS